MQNIIIASDHAGFELKSKIIEDFKGQYQFQDLGANSTQSVDYTDYAHSLADHIGRDDIGILICGSGIGISIAANRHANVRAALCRNLEDVVLARGHNDANVLVLGARMTDFEEAKLMLEKFIETEFEGGRHQRRIDKMNKAIKENM